MHLVNVHHLYRYIRSNRCTWRVWEKSRERGVHGRGGEMRVSLSHNLGVVSCPYLYTAAISLGRCVQGVGTRVARVGGRCAVVWLASEWHRVVCAVCVACGTQGGPLFMHKVPVSHRCLGSVALTHPLSPSLPPTHTSPPPHTQVSILVMFRTVYPANVWPALQWLLSDCTECCVCCSRLYHSLFCTLPYILWVPVDGMNTVTQWFQYHASVSRNWRPHCAVLDVQGMYYRLPTLHGCHALFTPANTWLHNMVPLISGCLSHERKM